MGMKSCWNLKIIFGNCDHYVHSVCLLLLGEYFLICQGILVPSSSRVSSPLLGHEDKGTTLLQKVWTTDPYPTRLESLSKWLWEPQIFQCIVCASDEAEEVEPEDAMKPDPEIEKQLLRCLSEASLTLPTTSRELAAAVGKQLGRHIFHIAVVNLLQKFTTQQLIVWVMVPRHVDCEWTEPPTEVYDHPLES